MSLCGRSECELYFHSSPMGIPGEAENPTLQLLVLWEASSETRPRHTEFYMPSLVECITMMYEAELLAYCAEACFSSLTSSCTINPPNAPRALLANPSIVSNQSFGLFRSCSLPQHDPPTYSLIRIDRFSVSECSCAGLKTSPTSHDKWVSELSGRMSRCADQCQSSDSWIFTC